jgi:phosphonate transport system substrate-binding protein
VRAVAEAVNAPYNRAAFDAESRRELEAEQRRAQQRQQQQAPAPARAQ